MKLFTCLDAGTLAGKQCTNVFWSPTGKNILLADLKGHNGTLEFFNVDDMQVLAGMQAVADFNRHFQVS